MCRCKLPVQLPHEPKQFSKQVLQQVQIRGGTQCLVSERCCNGSYNIKLYTDGLADEPVSSLVLYELEELSVGNGGLPL